MVLRLGSCGRCFAGSFVIVRRSICMVQESGYVLSSRPPLRKPTIWEVPSGSWSGMPVTAVRVPGRAGWPGAAGRTIASTSGAR